MIGVLFLGMVFLGICLLVVGLIKEKKRKGENFVIIGAVFMVIFGVILLFQHVIFRLLLLSQN